MARLLSKLQPLSKVDSTPHQTPPCKLYTTNMQKFKITEVFHIPERETKLV